MATLTSIEGHFPGSTTGFEETLIAEAVVTPKFI